MTDQALQLLERFSCYAVHRSGTDYHCRRTALEILDECEKMGLRIHGIDGFFLTDTTTHQPIEWIFAATAASTDYDAARRFIHSAAALPLFYELVIEDPKNESSGDRSTP
jgi:hypothetical protein